MLGDLKTLSISVNENLGTLATTQNVNGLTHRTGMSASKVSTNHRAPLVSSLRCSAPTFASMTEAHQPPVMAYSGLPHTIAELKGGNEDVYGTNPLESKVDDFLRAAGFSSVLTSGAQLRRMGVILGHNAIIECAWHSYDPWDCSDFGQECLKANARVVACVVRTDQGFIGNLTVYLPN